MTQETFNSNYKQMAMAKPFASEGLVDNIPATSADDFCLTVGWPDSYSASKNVKRSQMNAIGKIATQNDFFEMCGGINTFNAELASKIGGYPKGAILKYVVGDQIMEVQSIVDDNTYDFVANGVDEIHWHLCNRDIGHIASQILADESIEKISLVGESGSSATIILDVFSGSMPITGYLNIMFLPGSRPDGAGLQSFTAEVIAKCKKNGSWVLYDGDLLNYGTPIRVQLKYTGSATVEGAKYKISVNP